MIERPDLPSSKPEHVFWAVEVPPDARRRELVQSQQVLGFQASHELSQPLFFLGKRGELPPQPGRQSDGMPSPSPVHGKRRLFSRLFVGSHQRLHDLGPYRLIH